MLKVTDALTVTFVTIAAGGGITGRLFKFPEVVETLADTQQNKLALFGSRIYHHVLSSFLPAIIAVCPELIASKDP